MITTNQELYDVVGDLMNALRKAGEPNLSEGLHSALSISTLPGEVLGEIRLQLERVKGSRPYDQIHIRRAVDEAIRYINGALGS